MEVHSFLDNNQDQSKRLLSESKNKTVVRNIFKDVFTELSSPAERHIPMWSCLKIADLREKYMNLDATERMKLMWAIMDICSVTADEIRDLLSTSHASSDHPAPNSSSSVNLFEDKTISLGVSKGKISQPVYDEKTCIICDQTSKSLKLLKGTDLGRAKILAAAKEQNDELLLQKAAEYPLFLYHVPDNARNKVKQGKNCYSNYIKRGARASKRTHEETIDDKKDDENCEIDISTQEEQDDETEDGRRVRCRSASSAGAPSVSTKVCIFCDKQRFSGGSRTTELLRIGEKDAAQKFLDAININDDEVKRRCVFLNTVGDVFAYDIMYHRPCFKKYFASFKRKCDLVLQSIEHEEESLEVDENAKRVFESIEKKLESEKGLRISDIRDELNQGIRDSDNNLDNRKVKVLLLRHFEDKICFTYPANKQKSQMVFSSKLITSSVVEAAGKSEAMGINDLSDDLRKECMGYDYGLKESYYTSSDLKIAMTNYQLKRPVKWLKFISSLFPHLSSLKTDEWLLKFDFIFQFFHYWMTNGNITPFHCSYAQTMHTLSKSRQLIDMSNRLNLCVSYDTMKRISAAYAQKLVDDTKPNKCPLSSLIDDAYPIQGAMDNFDHNENTADGKSSAHDTVLVIFQNTEISSTMPAEEMTVGAGSFGKRKFSDELPCQVLKKSHLIRGTSELPSGFSVSPFHPNTSIVRDLCQDHFLWTRSRNLARTNDELSQVPSFTALKSSLKAERIPFHPTTSSFIPILPYPATEMDSIFTTMLNFQDVLKQRGEPYGALWCDEGVYCIAKEIQLLRPEEFSDVFLGLGPFHMERIVLGCLGSFLGCVGVDIALSESNVFGSDVVNSKVMTGKHYIKSKEGMELIADAMSSLLFDAFRSDPTFIIDDHLLEQYDAAIQSVLQQHENRELGELRMEWEHAKVLQTDILSHFEEWKKDNVNNENIAYWTTFLDKIYPIQQGLTFSIRSGNWELFLSALSRAIPLFFAFGRTNYSRWAPLFLEDCLDLNRKMPDLHKHFKNGGWVMYFGSKKCSAIGMDMALEKVYNKPAKQVGGIIGMTSRKEAVAQWNILKHEKDLHVGNMLHWTNLSGSKERDSELDLHHEFSNNSAVKSNGRVKMFLNYIEIVGGPFDLLDTKLRHICNGSSLPGNVVKGILGCVQGCESCYVGESCYESFKQQRFIDKSKSIHDTIQNNRKIVLPAPICDSITETPSRSRVVKSKQDISDALRFIEASRDRGYDNMRDVLTHEITSTSYFLVSETKEGHRLKKCDKSELSRELILKGSSALIEADSQLSVDATIIDFMAMVRKVPVKKCGIKTYGDLALALHDFMFRRGHNSRRIDIIFDIYSKYSPKHCERATRGQASSAITVSIKSDGQNLPVNLDLFWSSNENKAALQKYFYNWMLRTYSGDKEIVFGGLEGGHCYKIKDKTEHCCTDLFSSQEEADERICLHVTHANRTGFSRVLVVSPDTDVFLCLIYHMQESWSAKELFIRMGSGNKVKTIAVHEIVKNLQSSLVKHILPYHALTGCDTTSKVGSKLACFSKSLNMNLLNGFGEHPLTEREIKDAEKFLLGTLPKQRQVETFDDYRYEQYHDMKSLDFNKLVCSSSTIKEHIKRAHHQAMRWKMSARPPPSYPDPSMGYGYEFKMGLLLPIIIPGSSRPNSIPDPCKCKNCTKNTCACRKAKVKCCKFCKCGDECKNPLL